MARDRLDAERAVGGAARVVPVRLADPLLAAVDARARREGATRSEVIRAALRSYLVSDLDGLVPGELLLPPGIEDELRRICKRFGVQRLEVFGSYARGEATTSSDIDLLYTLAPGVRLGWAIDELSTALEAVLGRPVDLVARAALHPRLRDQVLAEAQVLYAA